MIKKRSVNKSWLQQSAEALDIILDEDPGDMPLLDEPLENMYLNMQRISTGMCEMTNATQVTSVMMNSMPRTIESKPQTLGSNSRVYFSLTFLGKW